MSNTLAADLAALTAEPHPAVRANHDAGHAFAADPAAYLRERQAAAVAAARANAERTFAARGLDPARLQHRGGRA